MTLMITFTVITANAQEINIPEPEFADQGYIFTAYDEPQLLIRENAYVKIKRNAGVSILISPLLARARSFYRIEGKESPIHVSRINGQIQLIIKCTDNNTDPAAYINILKFEIKGKRREYLSASANITGGKAKNNAMLSFSAKKYGTSSYLITITDPEPGEYAIQIGSPTATTNKNSMSFLTFGIK